MLAREANSWFGDIATKSNESRARGASLVFKADGRRDLSTKVKWEEGRAGSFPGNNSTTFRQASPYHIQGPQRRTGLRRTGSDADPLLSCGCASTSWRPAIVSACCGHRSNNAVYSVGDICRTVMLMMHSGIQRRLLE